MAFITAVPAAFKSINSTGVCTTSPISVQCKTAVLRRSTFAGAHVKNVGLPSQGGEWSLTKMVVTKDEVLKAQQLWADGVVKIGSLKYDREACEAYTDQFLNERYLFNAGNVLFKPTKCAETQFRPTKPDAISYFIAGSKKQYAEDGGFAVTPWTHIQFENSDMIFQPGRAFAMGNYYFTDTSGGVTKVEYTFGYKKVGDDLKIDLHHSSIPFPSPA